MSELELQQQINALMARVKDLERLERMGRLVDYSSTSTVTGWSAYDSGFPDIYYMRAGNLVFVWYQIEGTSNSASTSFTLPVACNSSVLVQFTARVKDNGGSFAAGAATLAAGGSTVNLYSDVAGTAWTASGAKAIRGFIVYGV